MEVYATTATPRPIDSISIAAGFCYGKREAKDKRVANCIKAGHFSVLEHASIMFEVLGISRACMAQLTRHRLASFCVESQRYCKYDLSGNDWYVVPPEMNDIIVDEEGGSFADTFFAAAMDSAAVDYEMALSHGLRPEDARYLLPNATKTNLTMTCNARELFHILEMRCDNAAQWEIRELAEKLKAAAKSVSPQWCVLVEMWEENRG